MYVFNTKYTSDDVSAYTDADYPVEQIGWLELPRGLRQLYSSDHIDRLKIRETVDETSCSFYLSNDDIDVMKYDVVLMSRDAVWVTSLSSDYALSGDACYLLVYVDDTGYTGSDTTGTVTIDGVDENDASVSDTITISGAGTYISNHKFKSIDPSGISAAGLSSCAVTIWGDTGTGFVRREVQIWGDTDGNDTFGLMYAGFLRIGTESVEYDDTVYKLIGVGYDDFQKSNEYIAGFRSQHRCSHYSMSGIEGDCDIKTTGAASANWQVNGKCFVGDYNTSHPNLTVLCDTDHRCADYNAGTEYLPFDGFSYYDSYGSESSPYYSPYPRNYFFGGIAIERMCQSYEHGRIFSRPTRLFRRATGKLNGAITDSDTSLSIDGFRGDSTGVGVELYFLVSDPSGNSEIMYSGFGYSGGSITVSRGRLLTEAQSFPDNSDVAFPEMGIVSNGLVSEDDMLLEANIRSTIWATMESYTNLMTERMVNSEWVCWVDKYRQIHFSEMYGDNLGHSDTFEISEQDIASVSGLKVSPVVNSVSAWVTMDDGARYYPTINAEDTTADPSGNSVARYGRVHEEISNKHLNAIGDSSGNYIGFKTYATNYLKVHAFPKHSQTIELLYPFIPDEHYWSLNSDPLLDYSDHVNQHIDLRTHRIQCPDYNQPGAPERTFVVEGISYKADKYNHLRVFLYLSRIATE